MDKIIKELKRDLIRKSGAVKRTIKEYISYVKETEKEKEKLEKINGRLYSKWFNCNCRWRL